MRTKLLIAAILLFAGLPFAVTGVHVTSAATLATPKPTPEKPLTKARVEALIEKLADSLPDAIIEIDGQVDYYVERWKERKDLVGKTKTQIIKILFADLQTQLDDEETLGFAWSNWTGQNPKNYPRSKDAPPKPKSTP